MGYIPTTAVQSLQNEIKLAYDSEFYVSPTAAAAKQLALHVDPNFDILSSVGGSAKAASANDEENGSDSHKLRTALIVVGVLAGVGLLAFAAYIYRSKKQNKQKALARRNTRGGGATIRSFGGPGSLRETWTPNPREEERVMNGQLAETWSHHDPQYQDQDDGIMRESNQGHSVFGDPFIDAYGVARNRASRETERSSNSGNSGSGSSQNHTMSGAASVISNMTEAQRIQYEYEEAHGGNGNGNGYALGGSPTAAASFSMINQHSDDLQNDYSSEYHQPQQYTTSHSYGNYQPPPVSGNSGNRQRKRGSVASSTIGRPEMKSNSMLF